MHLGQRTAARRARARPGRHISPISPLYLPYISPISPLYLPYISSAPRPATRPNPHPDPNPNLSPNPNRNPSPKPNQAGYEAAGGYAVNATVARVLKGLGFSDAEFDRPCASFSGGWQMRIGLARRPL